MSSRAGLVLIDGVAGEPGISVFDDGLLRGDGCFEAIRSYDGRPFALEEHYRRLANSAGALGIRVPSAADLGLWVERVAAVGGDCIVRVVLTRGETLPGRSSPARCVVMSHPLGPALVQLSLLPVPAPWHAAGRPWELSGVKTISYAPNQAATRVARQGGYDDALLIADSGMILEGPTFSFAWTVGGVLETAGLDTGILDSITRRLVIAACAPLGIRVVEGQFDLGRLQNATEAMAISTAKQVVPVTTVGETTYSAGEIAATLDKAITERVHEMAPQVIVGR